MVDRIARTTSGANSWFFAENGSIDGGTTQVCSRGTQDGTYPRRLNTYPCAPARYGRRNPHAARVLSVSQSRPMWHRQTTRAPAPTSAPVSPAVCGSCSSTMSPGRTCATSSAPLAASTAA
jgi:hypothetical protein